MNNWRQWNVNDKGVDIPTGLVEVVCRNGRQSKPRPSTDFGWAKGQPRDWDIVLWRPSDGSPPPAFDRCTCCDCPVPRVFQ